jgi:hypothetical protein
MHQRRRGRAIAWQLRRQNWPWFSFASTHPSLYVLGAGASAPTIPKRAADVIRQEVARLGVWGSYGPGAAATCKPIFGLEPHFVLILVAG